MRPILLAPIRTLDPAELMFLIPVLAVLFVFLLGLAGLISD
ncbi:MAG TPA: hypothetical protein VLA68_04100 [Nitrososphaera sp.]|nr:hypothetical protein [Nitrososphaera sp.]